MNDYYIYEWFNIETDEVFYVGKGKKGRHKIITGRNPYFTNYYNKYNCESRIVFNNLTELEAFELEIKTIKRYKENCLCKCNLTEGGEQPPTLYGKDNAMYGRPWWDDNTPIEKIEKWRKSRYSFGCGELNLQFGISPKDRMDKDTYEGWKEKHIGLGIGENNSQYQVSPKDRMDEKTYLQWKENHKFIIGDKNPNAKCVNMYDINNKLYKSFTYIGDCVKFLIDNNITIFKENTIRTKIRNSSSETIPFEGYYFKVI